MTNHTNDEKTRVEEEQVQKNRVLSLINKIRKGEERIRILQGELKLRNKELPTKQIQEKICKKQA